MPGPVRVFIASSLDGFIAGPGDDLSFLPEPREDGDDYGYADFMAGTAAILMGPRTYDVVAGFENVEWPYGDTPLYVATARPLEPMAPTVRAVAGTPSQMLDAIAADVGDGGIYLDGGRLIRTFLDAGLVDELTLTVINHILGDGVPLFAGAQHGRPLELLDVKGFDDGLVQLRYRVGT